jgi:hypothetical protein
MIPMYCSNPPWWPCAFSTCDQSLKKNPPPHLRFFACVVAYNIKKEILFSYNNTPLVHVTPDVFLELPPYRSMDVMPEFDVHFFLSCGPNNIICHTATRRELQSGTHLYRLHCKWDHITEWIFAYNNKFRYVHSTVTPFIRVYTEAHLKHSGDSNYQWYQTFNLVLL